jgi:hypothetical protein
VQASYIFLTLAALTALRAAFGRFYYSFGRYRSFFDQLLLRSCWTLLAFLFLLSQATRPATSPVNFNDSDTPIFVFLLICCGLLEFASVLLFRSRLENDLVIVHADGFGEIALQKSDVQLVFHMRAAPKGLSNQSLMVPRSRLIRPPPKILVYQILLRTVDRYPFKYLVLAEVRSFKLAEKLTQDLASRIGVKTLDEGITPKGARSTSQTPDPQTPD